MWTVEVIHISVFISVFVVIHFGLLKFKHKEYREWRLGKETYSFEEDSQTSHLFDSNDMLICLDVLRLKKECKFEISSSFGSESNSLSIQRNNTIRTKPLHFAFIGDSRVRQFYYSFLQLLPDYDREKTATPEGVLHVDRFAFSPLLNLFVSFRWRPTLLNVEGKNLTDMLIVWKQLESQKRNSDLPDVIFLGIAVHHMLHTYGGDPLLYREKLKELAPVLNELSETSQIMWLNQFPTLDHLWLYSSDIDSKKIFQYNQIIHQVLEKSGIEIWRGSDTLVAEYVRACMLNNKSDEADAGIAYFKCLDSIHPGRVVLDKYARLLFRDICTRGLSEPFFKQL